MVKYAAHKLRRAPVAGKPHCAVNSFKVYRLAVRALVEQTQRVSHTAVGKPGDKLRRLMAELEVFLLCDVLEVFGNVGSVDAPKAVPLAA